MTWFWIITLQWNAAGGTTDTGVASGTLTPGQAAALGTRSVAYAAALDAGRRGLGIPPEARAAVLFFSLEPEPLEPPPTITPEPALAAGGAS